MKYLFTSDWHVRYDQPTCRIDSFMDTQIKILKQIRDIAQENNATMIIAGDLFHRSKENMPFLIAFMIEMGKDMYNNTGNYIYLILGQHGVNFHDIQNIEDTNVNVLLKSGYYKLLSKNPILQKDIEVHGFNWNEKIKCI